MLYYKICVLYYMNLNKNSIKNKIKCKILWID